MVVMMVVVMVMVMMMKMIVMLSPSNLLLARGNEFVCWCCAVFCSVRWWTADDGGDDGGGDGDGNDDEDDRNVVSHQPTARAWLQRRGELVCDVDECVVLEN